MGDDITGLARLSLADKLVVAPTSLSEGRGELVGILMASMGGPLVEVGLRVAMLLTFVGYAAGRVVDQRRMWSTWHLCTG